MIYPSGWCLFLCHLASIQCRANIPTALWQLCIQSIFSAEGTKLSIINYCLFSLFVQTKAFAASLMMITLNEVSQQSLHWHNFPTMYPFWINKNVFYYVVFYYSTRNTINVCLLSHGMGIQLKLMFLFEYCQTIILLLRIKNSARQQDWFCF